MFGLFKKRKTITEHYQNLDYKKQIAESHGWLLEEVSDGLSGPASMSRTIRLTKEILVDEWARLFEGGKPHWPIITMRMSILHETVTVNNSSSVYGTGIEKVFRGTFTGQQLKALDDQVIKEALGFKVPQSLEIVVNDYKQSLKNGSLLGLRNEGQVEILDFVKRQSPDS